MNMDFTGALTEKIGPLPGYAYVVIGVGGVFAFRKFRSNDSSGGYVPTSMAAAETPAPAMIAEANDQPLPSNQQWALQAANHLKRTSVFKASDISTALYNYLTGSGLTEAQQNIVNAALSAVGFPSEGLLPAYAVDVPTPYVDPYSSVFANMPYAPEVIPNPYVPDVYIPAPVVPAPVVNLPYVPNPVTPPSVVLPYVDTYVPTYVPLTGINLNPARANEGSYIAPIAGVTYNPTQNLDRNYDTNYAAPVVVAPIVSAPTQGTVDMAGIA